MRLLLVPLLIGCAAPPRGHERRPPAPEVAGTCRAIADDVERIARGYAQLAEFTATRAIARDCVIDYQFRTHAPRAQGGWSSGVPSPDPDGVWFYIGLWDPRDPAEAVSQINTQPVMPDWRIGERRVTFLVLEGARVKPVAAELFAILKRHGMTAP